METICRKCKKSAESTCSCDKTFLFCHEHIVEHIMTCKGQHKQINLKSSQDELYKRCKVNLEKIKQVKTILINRSKLMTEAI